MSKLLSLFFLSYLLACPLFSQTPQVEQVIMRTATSYGISGVYVENRVYFLFNDGSIYREPKQPPKAVKVSQSRQQEPKKWGTWKMAGNEIEATFKGKPSRWKKWFSVRSGDINLKLQGKYQSADSFGGSEVHNFNTISFTVSGQFAWKTLKGGNTAWLPAYAKSSSGGTYKITGHSIELTYNSGKVERFFFGYYPKDQDHFVIAGNHFAPLD